MSRQRRPSILRILRQIKLHKRAILRHRDELVKLRDELQTADFCIEDAHRSLQEAINDLGRLG